MDLINDLDISDTKWDDLICLISDNSQCVFFYGIRLNYVEYVENAIGYVADEILIDDNGSLNTLLLRIMDINIINRGMLSKLWEHYESPSLVFLKNIEDEGLLVDTIKLNRYYDTLLNTIKGIYILSQDFEQNVLWLRGNNQVIMEKINHLYK